MVGEPFGPEAEPIDAELANAKVDAAAAERRRRRRERDLGGTEATCRGLLAGLRQAGDTAVFVTTSGRISASVVVVGDDCVQLDEVRGNVVTVRLDDLVAVEAPSSSSTGATADPDPPSPMHLSDVVAGYVDTALDVTLVVRGGGRLDGRVRSCGVDVAVVRPSGAGPATYVALDSVNEVWSSSMP
jgi:hypothetical protein